MEAETLGLGFRNQDKRVKRIWERGRAGERTAPSKKMMVTAIGSIMHMAFTYIKNTSGLAKMPTKKISPNIVRNISWKSIWDRIFQGKTTRSTSLTAGNDIHGERLKWKNEKERNDTLKCSEEVVA